ncbi:MAG: ABC transporter ATP-binding protein [Pseudomonadota bacterium]
MGSITLQSVEKWFGSTQVIQGIDLEINDGEFVIFVGPSGCGKSTLLRMIAGLEETSRGKILLDGADVTDRVPSERELSMVFQSYALYPHMSVRDNVGFGLKTAGENRQDIKRKVDHAAEILELNQYMDRRPKALSGGQRQRVAIGRAIVREPKGFLFDEPLSNLDAALRVQMRFEIAKLHDTLKTTMIYVTHDQVEAMTLADKIVVLKDGQIMQVGTPRELYENPQNLFVAQFIGSPKMNVMPCSADKTNFQLPGHGSGPHGLVGDAASVKHIGVRPEHITLGAAKDAQCSGVVEVIEYLGADTFLYIQSPELGMITVRTEDLGPGVKGQEVHLHFDKGKVMYFSDNARVV